jgi:2-haloacid dehalogenase
MLDFSRFEVFTFDCYGTLINWEAGMLPVLRRILAQHGKKLDDSTLLKLYGDFELLSEQGSFRPYREVLQSVVRRFGAELGFVPTEKDVQSLPESLPDWRPWPDTVAALRELKRKFRLVILSNVDDDLFAATRPQLEVHFDDVITAQQAQAYKPSRKIFDLALKRIKSPVERILHVAQSVYHDMVPAQALGLATVWVNRPSARAGIGAVKAAQAVPDLEVASLAELVAAVGK